MRCARWRLVVLLTVTVCLSEPGVAALRGAATVAPAIRLPEETPDPREDLRRLVSGDDPELHALYAPTFAPIWLDETGAPTRSARDALRLLARSGDEGLDPSDYPTAWTRGSEGPPWASVGVPELARADVELSKAVLRYARDLHMGRIDPRVIGFQLNVPRDGHDFAALVRAGVARDQVVATLLALRPRDPQYLALAAELARYRLRAAGDRVPELPRVKRVKPGERYPGVPALWERLAYLGDAPPDVAPPAGDDYDGLIVDAVRGFQRRHGLEVDGVLGARTFDALAVPLAWRVRQIELAMERLRWLPHEGDGRMIVVNVPLFRLFAWNTVPAQGVPAFSTGVIVGRAVHTQTPIFSATLTEILFRPYWNVPISIVRKEVLPALARDPAYFVTHDMELVAGQGDRSPVVEATPANIARLRSGAVRLRQRPGPKNSLGLIKFSFPNENDVYMHATPAQALFARSRRDFSHGCVRVEDPVGLAEWVLRDPAWSREAIEAAMQAPQASRVAVTPPVRVMLLYTTAVIQLDSGALVFAEDIYRHDGRLDAALRARR